MAEKPKISAADAIQESPHLRDKFAAGIAAGSLERELLNQKIFTEQEIVEASKKSNNMEELIYRLSELAANDTEMGKELYKNIEVISKNPDKLLTPDQLKQVTAYISKQLELEPGAEKKGLTIDESMRLVNGSAILKELSLAQRQQVLDFFYKEASEHSFGLAKAFIECELLAKETVLQIAAEYGREAELEGVLPVTEQPTESQTNKILAKMRTKMGGAIATDSLVLDKRRMTGLIGMYYAGITALVNLGLYLGDSFQKGGPGDNRYLAMAGLFGLGSVAATEVATSRTSKDKGLVWSYIRDKAEGNKDAIKSRKELQRVVNLAVFRNPDAQAVYVDNPETAPLLKEVVAEMQIDAKKEDVLLAAREPGTGKDTMSGRILRKLDSIPSEERKPEHDEIARFIKAKKVSNEELLEVAFAYDAFKVTSREDIVNSFGFNKSMYA